MEMRDYTVESFARCLEEKLVHELVNRTGDRKDLDLFQGQLISVAWHMQRELDLLDFTTMMFNVMTFEFRWYESSCFRHIFLWKESISISVQYGSTLKCLCDLGFGAPPPNATGQATAWQSQQYQTFGLIDSTKKPQ